MRPLLTLLLVLVPFLSTALAGEVRLSAAASMAEATKALIAAYAKGATDVTFLPNFGGSGGLAKQIEQGAPADLYISANPKWMGYLVELGRVSPERVRTLAVNTLVVVGQRNDAVRALGDLIRVERVAIGSPKSVPAGAYATQALERAGLMDALQPRLILARDVRQALAYAEQGEVDVAFVYGTDALLATEAVILMEVDPTLYDPVTYPVGLTVEGAANPAAVAFYDYLATPEAAGILAAHGFRAP